ncbi:MAG: hypothetical protein GY777_17450 [Candidatus Brocadiaceae bacterium]|nr:hypothetical protein [Candidatus Brocadiaceae bacterium]
MNKSVWSLLAIFTLFTLVGCLQNKTVVKLNPDGSGTLEETVMVSKSFIKQMDDMAKSMISQMSAGMGQAGQKDGQVEHKPNGFNIFDETKLTKKANEMGEGVTYLSGEKVSSDKFEGYKAIYNFTDINKLSINQNPSDKVSLGQGGNATMTVKKREDITFRFASGEESELTIRMPKPESKKKTGPSKPGSTQNIQANDQQTEMMMNRMKMMLDGMKIAMSIEVQGDIIETNATHREGSRITLMEMDFSKLLQLPDQFKKFAQANATSLMETKKLLKNIPGIKVDLNEEITLKIK